MDSADQGSPSTRELILRAQQGSREALDVLFRRYQPRLDAFILLRVGRKLRYWVGCEDIAQETLLQAIQGIQGFEWRGEGSFYRWLAGIAEHVILRRVREQERPTNSSVPTPEDLPMSGDSPSTDMRRWERLEKLKNAVEHLSPDHREAVILIYFRGLRTAEIAERMGNRSVDAIHMLHLRAVRKLRKLLGSTDSLSLPDVLPEEWEARGRQPAGDPPDRSGAGAS